MDGVAVNHEEPSNDPGFTRLDKLRLGGKAARVLLKTTVKRPNYMFISLGEIFGYISEENFSKREAMRERIGDRVFIDICNYVLKHEMGNETHRLYLADHLAELRYEYGLPLDMPVQSMKQQV